MSCIDLGSDEMKKKEMYEYMGSMQQMAYVRNLKFDEGQASEMKAVQVKNGPMSFIIMKDKCLDIAELSYKGIQLNFLAKQGFQGPVFGKSDDQIRSIMGGLFFTAGFENIGGGYQKDGKIYPLHGSMRLTPAEHVSSRAYWDRDEYHLSVEGEIRHAALFGENVVMLRKIETSLGSREIVITDVIENESFEDACKMRLYHFNVGYPLLNENGQVVLPTKQVTDRDEYNYEEASHWKQMEKPVAGATESVYVHELAEDAEGWTFAAYINPESELGLKIQFKKIDFPYFVEWKSLGSGDYALGLEPSNSHICGRQYHEERGTLPVLKPFEKERVVLKIQVLDGIEELEEVKREAEQLLKQQ
jgi:hypothetical protein